MKITKDEIATRKFGRLRIKEPESINHGSAKKVEWICDCGKSKFISFKNVISGKSSSCGRCYDVIHDWYLKNKEKIKTLRCPVKPEDFPTGGIKPLEIIKNIHTPFKCKCFICGNIYYPRLHGIKCTGCSLTCGCATYRVSRQQRKISEYIKSLGFNTEFEYDVGGLKYDIFVQDNNILIEYNGRYWHLDDDSKRRDNIKHQNAINHDYLFLSISEHEWVKCNDYIKQIISDILTF